jgi:hypothetical protein
VRGAVEMDLGGETFADQAIADRHGGDDHLFAVAHLAALDGEVFAERQEFRVVLDARDESEHVIGGMRHGMGGFINMHGRCAGALP